MSLINFNPYQDLVLLFSLMSLITILIYPYFYFHLYFWPLAIFNGISLCIYVQTYVCMHMFIYLCPNLFISISTSKIYLSLFLSFISLSLYIYMNIFTHLYLFLFTCLAVYVSPMCFSFYIPANLFILFPSPSFSFVSFSLPHLSLFLLSPPSF